jgi:pyroglutamyl-peptidase
MGRMVLAAFEPFGGRGVNRSWQAVERVAADVRRVRLPVAFGALRERVPELVRGARGVLIVGEADRPVVSVERLAHNQVDARLPDNAGAQPRGEAIDAGGPATRAATWDADAAIAALRDARVPAARSDDPGRFACNFSLYLALAAAPPGVPVGFLHVPTARWPVGPSLGRLAAGIARVLLTFPAARVT